MSPLITIFTTVFIDLLGFGIVIPLLPIYSKAYGAPEWMLGLLFASFSAMQFLFAPMWGRVSDRIGRRPVLLGGLFGTAGSYVLFAFADSMPLLFASRILAGFFGANVSTAQAYIADVTTDKDRSKGMGLIGAAFGLGFTMGPLIGGELVNISHMGPGLLAAGLSLAAASFGYFNLKEPERHRDEASRVFGFETVREVFATPRLWILYLLNYLAIFAFSGFESMFIQFGLNRFPETFHMPGSVEKASMEQILAAAPIAGRYMFFIGLVSAAIQGGLIRRLIPKYGETRLIVAGPAILAVSFLVIGFAPAGSWWVVVVGCALMPIGFGLNTPSTAGLISRASPAQRQGAYLGLSQSVASLARMTGPPFAGVMFALAGAQSPFWTGAAVLALGSLLAISYRRRFASTF